MNDTNKKRNRIWVKENNKSTLFESKLLIPNNSFNRVPFVNVRIARDLNKIPNEGGCYWIWTNEPVIHSLHKNRTPKTFNGGEIIYNGLAKDDIRGRIKKHLFGQKSEGWSAISIDILLTSKVKSHRKKALSNSPHAKVPYINRKRIKVKDDLLKLRLISTEKAFIKKTTSTEIYFRNGINIIEPKHKKFRFRVYFIVSLTSFSYADYLEKKWRAEYGLPKLCSYLKGR